jgi:Na+-transporting NADH:ubiquinone oxidoreductase subunit NqrE
MVSPRLRSVTVGFLGWGGEKNGAAPHFSPLPSITLNPEAERSRGHFDLLVSLRIIILNFIENRKNMSFFKTSLLPILVTGIWVSISEFFRNEILLKSHWTEHYQTMGLVFPAAPINGAVWGIWSFVFAASIYVISRRFSFWETTFLSWTVGFVLMWLGIGNMAVLPLGILYAAIPLSLLECGIASWIIFKFSKRRNSLTFSK